MNLTVISDFRLAIVQKFFEFCSLFCSFCTKSTQLHFLELEHILELQEETVFFQDAVRVRIDAHLDQHFLFEVLPVVAQLGQELVVGAHVLLLAALEHQVVHLPARARLVSVVRAVEPFAALRAEADVVIVHTQQLRCGRNHAFAFLAVEVPAAHEVLEVHAVDLLALLGFQNVPWLCSCLFEEVERPILLAGCI